MHPNWMSVFAIFSALKISRTVSGNDTRNVRLRKRPSLKGLWRTLRYVRNASPSSHAIFGIKKSEVLPSTSGSIVKTGFNKVWRRSQPTEHIPTSRVHPSPPGSGILSVPPKKASNEKQGVTHTPNLKPTTASNPAPQPAAVSILTHLPSHKASQPDVELPTSRSSTSNDPQLASGSVNLSFPQRIAKVAPILTYLPSPQTGQPEPEPVTPTGPWHPSGSRFLSFSLQKVANEKEPETSKNFGSIPQPAGVPLLTHPLSAEASQTEFAPILTLNQNIISFPHASPSNATQKRLAIKTKSLRPPSGSQFLRSPLQEVLTEQRLGPGIIGDPVPQILGSSTAKGSGSPQRDVGLSLFTAGQDAFYLPPISPQRFPSILLPNTIPPQSLLFLPPNPPPKGKINFNPFSPEEETVPLPPAPEPMSNQLCYPVRSPDDEFLNNILPSPLLPLYQVPYLSLPPTQSSTTPSPLLLDLLLSPLPVQVDPPTELIIKIGGLEGYPNAENYDSHITHFLLSRANEAANSLVVVWQLSHVDNGGARGIMSLKALFTKLNEKVFDSNRVALSSFSKLSITIPDLVRDVTPCNNLPQPFREDDSIDLTNALDLLEFTWRGDFAVLGLKFNHLPMTHLTVLNVNCTHISLNDALQLLHSCPNVGAVSLGTIQDVNVCDFGDLRKPSRIPHRFLGNLWSLTLESNIALHSFFERIGWFSLVSLVLTLRQDAVVDVYTLPLAWESCRDITFNSHLAPHALTHLRNEYPRLRYNDIESQ